jgi:hypothetical protein
MSTALSGIELHMQLVAPGLRLPSLKPLIDRTVFAMFVPAPDRSSPADIPRSDVEDLIARIADDVTRVFESAFALDEPLFLFVHANEPAGWDIDATDAEVEEMLAAGRVDLARRRRVAATEVDVEYRLRAQANRLRSFLDRTAAPRLEVRPYTERDGDAEVEASDVTVCAAVELTRSQIDCRALFAAVAAQDFGLDSALRVFLLVASEERQLYFAMPDDRWCELFSPTPDLLRESYGRFPALLDPVERARMEETFGYWPQALCADSRPLRCRDRRGTAIELRPARASTAGRSSSSTAGIRTAIRKRTGQSSSSRNGPNRRSRRTWPPTSGCFATER